MKYILIYLFLEVMVSTTIAGNLGGFLTFVEVILTAFIGVFLLRTFKYSLASNMKDLTQGQISQQDFLKRNVGNALGAILLIIPGFFTDILGILLQFGVMTMVMGKIFSFKPSQSQSQNSHSTNNQFYYESQFTQKPRGDEDDIIDVEVIDDHKPINH